ncbi:MAG: hypothetical protein N2645_02585 [Clostridia bacterium]|nr:hypothetical protein [Clostridia bacterium]
MDENTKSYDSDNIDSTLEEVSKELKPGETLVLDMGNSSTSQADIIYDTLVMRGYDVKKSNKRGSNQIYVNKRV